MVLCFMCVTGHLLLLLLTEAKIKVLGSGPMPCHKAGCGGMSKHGKPCAQALLSNAFAWMRQASEDSLDGMVALLQKVLQLYAARALSEAGAGELSPGTLVEHPMQGPEQKASPKA